MPQHASLSIPDDSTFAELWRRARAGGTHEFEQLVTPHLNVLLSLAAGILGRSADAEDAVQEALLRLYKKLPAVEGPREMRAYLCRLAINEARRIRLTRWFRLQRDAAPVTDATRLPEGKVAEQERASHYVRLFEIVSSLVPRLTRRERQVFLLHAFEELHYDEISEILSIRPVTCRRLYQLARQRITGILEKERGLRITFPD